MFTAEEIARIAAMIEEGHTPQQIAAQFRLPHSTFRMKLANSGYRIAIRRHLEKIVPITPSAHAPPYT